MFYLALYAAYISKYINVLHHSLTHCASCLLPLPPSRCSGNFTNPARYPCLGCQDGYLTQYLARNLRWTYTRLSVDGLRSIIFHGPSPTLCLAAGQLLLLLCSITVCML